MLVQLGKFLLYKDVTNIKMRAIQRNVSGFYDEVIHGKLPRLLTINHSEISEKHFENPKYLHTKFFRNTGIINGVTHLVRT